jgi:hypothetical protein
MDDQPDFDLHRTPSESGDLAPPATHPARLWVAAATLLVLLAGAAYFAFVWRPRPAPAPAAAATPAPAAPDSSQTLGGKSEPATLPPLDESDALVRTLVQALSESPAVMAWLPTTGLIRNFTVVVSNIADGATPARHLKVLRPSSSFRVIERDGGIYLDPRGYDRYAQVTDAVASIDPAAAAKLYATLRPRIEDANRDLGAGNQSFDRTLERAIVALLETPVVNGPVRLKPKGIGYAYADDRLESLSSAQKQLLRMGPHNMRIIKARLREIALALGIRPALLPNVP